MGLEGKIAIVTGGNRGIGLAIAERLAAEVGGIATAGDYVGSKAALLGITKSLTRELGPYNITRKKMSPTSIGGEFLIY